ncbi:MAG: DNA polymerase [Clostridiales bacterium]|nr:DNA polymerase [Clostridiales bacterium]
MEERKTEAEEKIAQIIDEIEAMCPGVAIGSNCSTNAFKLHLYKTLGLPVVKTTETNREAADDQAMQMLKEWCDKNKPELSHLFELVQEYRKWGKLKSTYIDGYLKYINSVTGRIHPDFFSLSTDTGRMNCRNPNIQNCFDSETEILTKRGFIPFSELQENDEVAQWSEGIVTFVHPENYICQQYDGDMVHLKNTHIDLMTTPDHRCLLQNRKNGQYTVVPAKDYSKDAKQLQAADYAFGNIHLTKDEITLLAATQADGYYHDGGIDFSFIKARKYRRLIRAIERMSIPHSDYPKKDGHINIRIFKGKISSWIMCLLGPQKCWNKWLLEFDKETILGILSEILEWDGCYTRMNHYSSSVKQNADWMQILYILTGTRAHLREYHNSNPRSATNYQLDITDRNYSMTTNIEKKLVEYHGKVYCVTVPSGFIVVRREGQVCITGNCPRATNDPIGVRSFIKAPEGCKFISNDFSQIELRVGAFYCRDEKCCGHITTAETYTHRPPALFSVSPMNRRRTSISPAIRNTEL